MTEKVDLQQIKNRLVVKNPDLIQKSRYSLPVQHQRVLLYMISKIKPKDGIDTKYTFTIQEFGAVAGLNTSNSGFYYKTIKEIIADLGNADLWITYTDEAGKSHEKPFFWLNPVTTDIEEGSGTITISFNPMLEPYLFNLQKWTQYHLS